MMSVDPGVLMVAALLSALSTLLAAYNSHLLISIEHHTGFGSYLAYFWVAWATGLVMPGQIGDVGVLSWLMKRKGMRWTLSLGRLFLDKLISLVVVALVAAWGLLNVLDRLELDYDRGGWILGLAVIAILVLVVAARIPAVRAGLSHVFAIVAESLNIARNHPQRVFVNVGLTVIKTGVLSLSFWFVFKAAGAHNVDYFIMLQLMMIGSIVAYLPLSMNGIGTVELAGVSLFGLFGYEPSLVLGVYLLARIMTIATAWVPAVFIMLYLYWNRAHESSAG